MFYRMLDLSGINSHIIYTANNTEDKQIPRRIYLRNLGFELVKNWLKIRSANPHIPRTIREKGKRYFEGSDQPIETKEPPKKRRGAQFVQERRIKKQNFIEKNVMTSCV